MGIMKRLIIILLMLIVTVPVFAKNREIKNDLFIGASQDEVKKALGKPSVITKDSDNNTAWIYENPSVIPAKTCSDFGGVYTDAQGTTVIIKFDSDDKVNSFSYHKSVL